VFLPDLFLTRPTECIIETCNANFTAKAKPKLRPNLAEWKKANARAISIIAQIIERPSTNSDACVIRVEYENSE
jgi:hypothetical protein